MILYKSKIKHRDLIRYFILNWYIQMIDFHTLIFSFLFLFSFCLLIIL